jgi:hypothetical protein
VLLFFDDNEAKCDVIETNGLVYELPPRYVLKVAQWGNDAAFCGSGGGRRSCLQTNIGVHYACWIKWYTMQLSCWLAGSLLYHCKHA